MSESMYPPTTRETTQKWRELAPEVQAAFDAFGQKVFAEGALSAKVKQIIAVAVAHVTQCPYCIKGHTKAALRAGAAFAHSALTLATIDEEDANRREPSKA